MKTLYEQFIEYLEDRFHPGNGDTLLRLEESGMYQNDFLSDNDLPLDTALEP